MTTNQSKVGTIDSGTCEETLEHYYKWLVTHPDRDPEEDGNCTPEEFYRELFSQHDPNDSAHTECTWREAGDAGTRWFISRNVQCAARREPLEIDGWVTRLSGQAIFATLIPSDGALRPLVYCGGGGSMDGMTDVEILDAALEALRKDLFER